MILVWQKVGLICFIAKAGFYGDISFLMEVIACLTALSGRFGGVWAVYYRTLMGYSSLVHSGWIILACIHRIWCVLFYILVYGIVRGFIMVRLYLMKFMCFEDFSNIHIDRGGSLFVIFADFISLGGLPVLPGFIPKVVVLTVIGVDHIFLVLCLLFASVIRLYYYLKVGIAVGVGAGMNFYLTRKRTQIANAIKAKWYVFWRGVFYILGFGGLVALIGIVGFSESEVHVGFSD